MDQEQIAAIIGATITKYREKRGWNQNELAQKLGVNRQNVWRIEQGKQVPSIATCIDYAGAFGLTLPGFLRDLEVVRKAELS